MPYVEETPIKFSHKPYRKDMTINIFLLEVLITGNALPTLVYYMYIHVDICVCLSLNYRPTIILVEVNIMD